MDNWTLQTSWSLIRTSKHGTMPRTYTNGFRKIVVSESQSSMQNTSTSKLLYRRSWKPMSECWRIFISATPDVNIQHVGCVYHIIQAFIFKYRCRNTYQYMWKMTSTEPLVKLMQLFALSHVKSTFNAYTTQCLLWHLLYELHIIYVSFTVPWFYKPNLSKRSSLNE